jgi:hypothetical protein
MALALEKEGALVPVKNQVAVRLEGAGSDGASLPPRP